MAVGVGLDIGTDSVKAVAVSVGARGARIVGAARVARPADGSFPADAVARALRASGIRRSATIGASGKDLMLRYVPVPPVPPWRLKVLVEFEIRENMAGGGSDVSSDYRPLNIAGGLKDGILVLAAVGKNAYLDARFADARAAGVWVRAACPNAVALYRCFAASSAFKAGETTFLLDIGRECCEMAIQKDGDVLFARNMTGQGGDKVTAGIDAAFGIGRDRAESYKRERAKLTLQPPEDSDKRQTVVYGALRELGDLIVSSVNSGLRFARIQTKAQDLDYGRLVLSGGGSRLSGLKEFLENRLQKTVVMFDPSAVIDSSSLRGDAAAAFGGAPSEMAVATGLALIDAARDKFSLSLLPPGEAASRHFWGRTVFGYVACGVAAVLAGAMAVRAHTDLSAARGARQALESQLTDLRARAQALTAIQKENLAERTNLSLLLDEARVNRAIVELLAAQRAGCPDGLSLVKLALVPGEDPARVAVEFSGRGVSLEQAEFLQKLETFRKALLGHTFVLAADISESPAEAEGLDAGVRSFTCRVELDPWARAPQGGAAADASTPGATPAPAPGAAEGGAR